MSLRLANKKALVTAAGQGIGRASAIALAKAGADVIATDINEDALNKLKNDYPNIDVAELNVLDKHSVKLFAHEVGAVDVLFNCAGFVHNGTILDCSEKDWNFSIDLNLKSMFYMCKALLPAMIENGGASIINMSSVASSVKGAPNRFIYGTSKAAVIGLTKSIAIDFIKQGIRCNAIAPGTVESPSWEQRVQSQGDDPEKTRKEFIARQPIGRVGKAEEIAALVVYLGSDESAYTTGTVQVIDGGWSI